MIQPWNNLLLMTQLYNSETRWKNSWLLTMLGCSPSIFIVLGNTLTMLVLMKILPDLSKLRRQSKNLIPDSEKIISRNVATETIQLLIMNLIFYICNIPRIISNGNGNVSSCPPFWIHVQMALNKISLTLCSCVNCLTYVFLSKMKKRLKISVLPYFSVNYLIINPNFF